VTADSAVPAFLLEWAGKDGPRKLLIVIRSRLEARRLGPRSHVEIELSEVERRQVGQLMTAGWAPSGAPVSTRELRSGLEQNGCSLEDLLRAVDGPLRDLPDERRQVQLGLGEARSVALEQLRGLLGVVVPDKVVAELNEALERWVLRRRPALERAAQIISTLDALPSDGDVVLLPVLAARLAQDAHALDRSKPLGRAMARFLSIRSAVATVPESASGDSPLASWQDPLSSGERWRQAWASGGVACDTVSSQVLVLNLPLAGDAPAVRLCAAATGEPLWLSLRSLTGSLSLSDSTDVFVCENPSVVEAAADRMGERCAPLICTFGRPSLAALRLLKALAPTARLRIRADGDSVGWGIVTSLAASFPAAELWRMPVGFSAFEEEILDDLIEDLGTSAPGE